MEAYIPEALLFIVLLCFIIQLYYLLFWQRYIAAYRLPQSDVSPAAVPVSVIISARNEAENLLKFLPLILQQDYSDFEVVVVNDCSVDNSHHILRDFSENYPHLKLVTVTEHPRFKTGKKFALTMGIKAAKYEHLLFTDADCQPASTHWISRMAGNFTNGTEIVLGYSPYIKTGGFLNAFIRFETLKTGINYLSAALKRNAYMGVGRNLAYTKSLFFKAKGFASHLHILSGDDDLFVNSNATISNTVIEIHPDAYTYSEAKSTFKSYFVQKRRHMGVGSLYKSRHKRMLSTEAVSGFLFYIAIGICLYLNIQPLIIAGVYAVRLITQAIVFQKSASKLGNLQLLWFLPFFDLIYYVYLNVFGLVGTFIKTTQWK